MCLKIDAKNPVLMGQASWGFGLVVVVSDGFSFGCEIVASSSLLWGLGVSVLQPEINYGFMDTLFRVLVGFLLVVSCIQWPSGPLIKHQRRV